MRASFIDSSLRPRLLACAILLSCVLSFYTTESLAQSLSVSPNRIVFEGRENNDQVLVSNADDDPHSYRVELLKRRMLDSGKYITVTDGEELPGELFANDLVRISPRAFKVDPKSSQTIRLRLTKKKDLPDGEYRSHLRVQVLPETGTPTLSEAGKININVKVNYGISIPIIVRQGDLSYSVKVKDMGVSKDASTGETLLNVEFTREGTRSSYGDIGVTFTDGSGKETLLKFLPGLSLFLPNPSRTFVIPLDIPAGMALSNGILKVTYREQESEGGKIIAEGTKSL